MAVWLSLTLGLVAADQDRDPPTLRAAALAGEHFVDGLLDEPPWALAPAIENLTMVDPVEGGVPTLPTQVKVLADARSLLIGIRCDDSNPDGIVSYSVERDASFFAEDHVRIILGPYQDGRSGYVFAVNPSGARYDALIVRQGEDENPSWDGIWEARTSRDSGGWTAEIRIPVVTLSFPRGLQAWHFNVQRRVERLRETSRWSGAKRDYEATQTSQAGLLTSLPDFDLGAGMSVRPATIVSVERAAPGRRDDVASEASLDITQKLGPNLLAQLTVNTDFAETEVDERRSNLTRFPLFFPEKRWFFLEGSDIFDFGLGAGRDALPFHSRRIGLVGGEAVPILYGGKLNGRLNGTSVGVLGVRTEELAGVAPETGMAVMRVKENVLQESSVGMIATYGDPLGRDGSWTVGADATYQTSRFLGDKNFLLGVWGLEANREDLEGGSRSALGAKVDYPNDLWDAAVSYKRVGEDFDPSLGFVPRAGIQKADFHVQFSPRPEGTVLRRLSFELDTSAVTDLEGTWQSYDVYASPVKLDFESGDGLEAGVLSDGDRPPEGFEIADGVVIPAGTYRWTRYRLQARTAYKRPFSVFASWYFGDYYDGTLDRYQAWAQWNPFPLVTFTAEAEKNVGHLEGGRFELDLYGLRTRLHLSPDLNLNTFLQYDTDSRSLGTNTRLHWVMTRESDLFFVVNYNARRTDAQWDRESYETILKLQYTFRF
jgi:hypothetical protein